MKFLKQNGLSILIIVFLIAVGVLLLVNPETFGIVVVRVAGLVLILLGVVDVIKYFRLKPNEAAKGSNFYMGALLISAGLFCEFGRDAFNQVFPVMAVVFGLVQILLGYLKLQKTIDALRLKQSAWWMRGVSALISILSGFIIAMNPHMTMVSIWVFTGLSMIIEGVLDAVVLILQTRKGRQADKADDDPNDESEDGPAAQPEPDAAEKPAAK